MNGCRVYEVLSFRKQWLAVTVWCFSIMVGYAQMPGVSYDLSWLGGRIIKHTAKLKFEIPALSQGTELTVRLQKYGKKPWHERHGYPVTGITFGYVDFGDPVHLGRAYSITGMLELYFVRKASWDIYFQPAAGIGLLDRPYNTITNPDANAIGSVVNSAVSFRFGTHAKINDKFRLHAGLTFNHWSNGGSFLPNFGINLPAPQIGIEYTPSRVEEQAFLHHDLNTKLTGRWGINIGAGITTKETLLPDGPSYPLYIASAAGSFRLTPVTTLLAGIEYELDMSVYRFGEHIFLYQDQRSALQGASRFIAFLGNEFHFGHSGILLQAGVYLGNKSFLVPLRYYTKLGYRYYFREFGQPGLNPYIGIYMKSHKIVAEYFALGIGLSL